MDIDFRKSVQVGLIGAGIQASRSPHLHECEARAVGIVCSYQLIDLAQLGVGVESLPQLLDADRDRNRARASLGGGFPSSPFRL